MHTTTIPAGVPLDLSRHIVGLERATGDAVLVERDGQGPPPRIDGYTIGAPEILGDSPHGGELHPDADELLYLVSGRIDVRLELPDGTRDVEIAAGDALVVPRGVWHRVAMKEPGRLLHITPGPGGAHRPLQHP